MNKRGGMRWENVLIALSLTTAIGRAQEAAITHHTITLDGGAAAYTAEVGRIAIRNVETGEPHGFMGYVAYRLDTADGTRRPVTFIWNGGPGANSSLLHFLVAGPRRYQSGKLIDNLETWLAASDLIMVDPIGTGFSRPAKPEYGDEFYGTRGDVASVSEFIRSWRLLQRAEDAPIYLVGESWGAARAASVAYSLETRGIRVRGLVLISGGWAINKTYGSAALRDALRVVDMASTAFYYRKTPPSLGSDLAQVRKNTERWVREVYAPGIARLEHSTAAERNSLRSALAQHTGVAVEQIDAEKITLAPRQFRENILKVEKEVPSPFDLRERKGEQPAFVAPVILRYLRDDLGFHTDLPYVDLEEPKLGYAPGGRYSTAVGERWNYATADLSEEEVKAAMEAAMRKGDGPPHLGPPLPATVEVLDLDPAVRVLVASGMYDGFLPCAAGAETWASLPAPLKTAITFKCYAGGHAMYRDEPVRLEMSRDIMALIRSNN